MASSFNSLCRTHASLSWVAVVMLGIPMLALGQSAQSSARPDRGVSPNGTYSLSDIERINLINGNLNLAIPLASLPPIAGGRLSFALRAQYNSKIWDVKRNEALTNGVPPLTRYVRDSIQQADLGGWRIGGSYSIKFQPPSLYDFGWLGPATEEDDYNFFIQKPYVDWVKVQLITPDGATHELRPLGKTPYQASARLFLKSYYWETPDKAPQGAMTYYSSDGTYIWAVINPSGSNPQWEVYLPDGTHIIKRTNFQRIIDPNGNSIKISTEDVGGGILVTHYLDEMATGVVREIKHTVAAGSESIEYNTVNGQPVTTDIHWRQITVTGQTYIVQDHFNGTNNTCERVGRFDSFPMEVISDIDVPQTEPGVERKFTFSYNSDPPLVQVPGLTWWTCDDPGDQIPIASSSKGWGSLSQMTAPSGAEVKYTYENDNIHFLLEAIQAPRERITKKDVKQTDTNTTDTWNYFSSQPIGTVVAPDGSRTSEFAYANDPAFASIYGGANGLRGMVYKTVHYLGTQPSVTIEKQWIRLLFEGGNDLQPGTADTTVFNAVVDTEYTTLHDASGAALKMSAKTFQYDFNGNMTQETAYDWFSPGLVARDQNPPNLPLGVPVSAAVLRVVTNTFHSQAIGGTSTNVYAKRVSGNPPSPLILNATKETTVSNATTPFSKTRFHYDGHNLDAEFNTLPLNGNVTKERHDRDGVWINLVHSYDSFGNRLSTNDPKGNITTWVYDTATHAQPISVTVDPDSTVSDDELVTTIAYDYHTGLVKIVTDPNGKQTTTDYTNQLLGGQDAFGRPGFVLGPEVIVTVGGVATTERHKVVYKYFDNTHKVEALSDLNTEGDGKLRTKTTTDQLGRIILTEMSENGTTYTVKTETEYQHAGRNTYASNPHRGADLTAGWARAKRDDLGRVIEVATFDSATRPTEGATDWNGRIQTTYNAEQTTVIDHAEKKRRSVSDGLGRLIRVDEPNEDGDLDAGDPPQPVQPTNYRYDARGNLIQIDQGAQHRYFKYDTLSRLIRARNVEQGINPGLELSDPATGNNQWSVGYEYDDSSNLKKRTNPAGTTVTYDYDGLNRVEKKTLSTGGVWDYTYDITDIPNAKGRLVSVVLHDGADGYFYDAYDAMGRVTASRQVTTSGTANNYTMSYGYNLAGAMTKQVYPSGKEYRTGYDGAGRVNDVSRYVNDAFDKRYASLFSYSAHGAVSGMQLGNSKWEHTVFNRRLQPTEIGLGANNGASDLLKLEYTYGATTNSGNVLTQKITAPRIQSGNLVLTQTYMYDELNRLQTASEDGTPTWTQTYDFDRWGNRAVTSNSYILPENFSLTPQSLAAFNQNANRIALGGFGYDTSGNLTGDPVAGANAMEYDAENRQTSYKKSGATTSYSYDGDGRRSKKTDPNNNTTIFVYNVLGQLIAEYTSGSPSQNGTSYLTSDHLGSTRVVTKQDGMVKARYDYLPFGEEIGSDRGNRTSVTGYGASDGTRQKFTQKERDIESGLDYFLARYYSSAQGRFTSADEPFVGQDRKDPQSWNLFTYARNNPLLYVDRTGNDYVLYQYDKDGKVINTYQVRDLAALPKGYTVYGGDENITYVKGPDGTLYTAKYVEGDPGGVKVQAQYTISALGDAVGAELDRSADASKKLIGGFAVGTAVVGTGVGGAAYLTGTALAGSSITTLGLSEAGVAPGAAAAESLFVSEATRQAFQRQLAQHGRAALEKSLQSFERRLAEHVTKLELYRKAGGYVSSVEKEIKIFKESIQAIKEILGK